MPTPRAGVVGSAVQSGPVGLIGSFDLGHIYWGVVESGHIALAMCGGRDVGLVYHILKVADVDAENIRHLGLGQPTVILGHQDKDLLDLVMGVVLALLWPWQGSCFDKSFEIVEFEAASQFCCIHTGYIVRSIRF
mgnify:CR=1 FL=1